MCRFCAPVDLRGPPLSTAPFMDAAKAPPPPNVAQDAPPAPAAGASGGRVDRAAFMARLAPVAGRSGAKGGRARAPDRKQRDVRRDARVMLRGLLTSEPDIIVSRELRETVAPAAVASSRAAPASIAEVGGRKGRLAETMRAFAGVPMMPHVRGLEWRT